MDDAQFPLTTTVMQLFEPTLPQYDYKWIFSVAKHMAKHMGSSRYPAEEIVNHWIKRPNVSNETGTTLHRFPCRPAYEKYVRKSLNGSLLELVAADKRFSSAIKKYGEENYEKVLQLFAPCTELSVHGIDRSTLVKCLRRLTSRERVVIICTLRRQSDPECRPSDAEIAIRLGTPSEPVSEESVRQTRYEARKKLNECLKGGN